ncbi:hypothetical protein C8Q74DRAFT_707619 [Fomes fomentarius]|nr:hypothetical protein C8Q74DRAFT_707619 [Fomes fomentarius]
MTWSTVILHLPWTYLLSLALLRVSLSTLGECSFLHPRSSRAILSMFLRICPGLDFRLDWTHSRLCMDLLNNDRSTCSYCIICYPPAPVVYRTSVSLLDIPCFTFLESLSSLSHCMHCFVFLWFCSVVGNGLCFFLHAHRIWCPSSSRYLLSCSRYPCTGLYRFLDNDAY